MLHCIVTLNYCLEVNTKTAITRLWWIGVLVTVWEKHGNLILNIFTWLLDDC